MKKTNITHNKDYVVKDDSISAPLDKDLFDLFVKQFTNYTIENVQKIGKLYFQISPDLFKIKETIKRDIFSMGIFLGEDHVGFKPSPALLDIIAKFPDVTKKIYVSDRAEWLFLCGRNILGDSVIKNPNNLRDGPVLVQNNLDENLGLGVFKMENELVIRCVLDRGSYLRVDEKGRAKKKNPIRFKR